MQMGKTTESYRVPLRAIERIHPYRPKDRGHSSRILSTVQNIDHYLSKGARDTLPSTLTKWDQ